MRELLTSAIAAVAIMSAAGCAKLALVPVPVANSSTNATSIVETVIYSFQGGLEA